MWKSAEGDIGLRLPVDFLLFLRLQSGFGRESERRGANRCVLRPYTSVAVTHVVGRAKLGGDTLHRKDQVLSP